jgi:hypothetical protein
LTPLWRGGQFVGEVLDYIGLATLAYGVLRWGLKGIAGRFARGCAFSFAAGTLVATPSGLVPIETIEVGDQVLCKDEQTGVESVCAVTRTFDHVAPTTLALTLESADQSRELVVTTSEHPFYGTGFSAAGHLRAGDVVLGSGDQLLEVADARWDQTGQAVFNLSVESGRSFFVGESGAWVHNCPASAEVRTARQIVAGLPDEFFQIGRCVECAQAIESALRANGIPGQVLNIRTVGGPRIAHIYSEFAKQSITSNGFHAAVRVKNTVFDNIVRNGVPYHQFVRSLDAPLGLNFSVLRFF